MFREFFIAFIPKLRASKTVMNGLLKPLFSIFDRSLHGNQRICSIHFVQVYGLTYSSPFLPPLFVWKGQWEMGRSSRCSTFSPLLWKGQMCGYQMCTAFNLPPGRSMCLVSGHMATICIKGWGLGFGIQNCVGYRSGTPDWKYFDLHFENKISLCW